MRDGLVSVQDATASAGVDADEIRHALAAKGWDWPQMGDGQLTRLAHSWSETSGTGALAPRTS